MTHEVDAGDWSELAELFDALGDLPAPERERRLAELRVARPALAARLSAMLSADLSGEGLLERSLDEVAPGLHAQLHGVDRLSRPGDAIGRYRLLSPLGSGGMGEVWLAERADGEYRQDVALKLLKRGMDTQAILRRFLQERSILARLSHPNIVRLLDGGMSDDGRPFYAMEHVVGRPVVQYAADERLGVRERVALVIAIADAVSYAHAQLVVHRDLKPSNILVDAKGSPHLLDFGIAKLLEETGDATMTGTQMRVMSPAYAAPEQILGEPVGTATDVYALGVLLHELLTGTLPHRRTSRDPAIMVAELAVETERASHALARSNRLEALYGDVDRRRLSRLVAGDLDLIIARATHRDPLRRYPTMAAFADDCRRWLDGRSIIARPDSAGYRMRTFVRRHRLGVTAVTATILALLVGLGAAVWQAGEAREQAARAERQAMRAERVKEFLITLFRQNDPENAHGQVLTASQVMATGAANLSTMLQDDPETRGDLLVAIGEIRYNLGDYESAVGNVEEGLALLDAVIPASDVRRAQAYFVRGQVLSSLDRPEDAEADLLRAREIYLGQPQAPAERLDDIDQGLASMARYTRPPGEASTLQRAVVARSAQRHGDDSLVVAQRRIWLALMLEGDGHFEEAEAAYRLALPIMQAANGPLDPAVCKAQATFAGLLDRLGKRDEAAGYFETSLAGLRQLYGEESGIYGSTVLSRGIHLLGRRKFKEAEADFRVALRAFHDLQATNVAHAHRYLGQALMGQKQFPQAADHYRLAELTYRRADLPKDVQRWRARADYGYARFRMGETQEGREAVQAALDGMRGIIDDGDVMQMRPLMILGEIARAQGDLDPSLAAHRRWHALAVAAFGEDATEALQSGQQIAVSLLARGRPEDVREAKGLMDGIIARARVAQSPFLQDYLATGAQVDAAFTPQASP